MSKYISGPELEDALIDVLVAIRTNRNATDDDLESTWEDVKSNLDILNRLLAEYMQACNGGTYGFKKKVRLGDSLEFNNGLKIILPEEIEGSWMRLEVESPEGTKMELIKGIRNEHNK